MKEISHRVAAIFLRAHQHKGAAQPLSSGKEGKSEKRIEAARFCCVHQRNAWAWRDAGDFWRKPYRISLRLRNMPHRAAPAARRRRMAKAEERAAGGRMKERKNSVTRLAVANNAHMRRCRGKSTAAAAPATCLARVLIDRGSSRDDHHYSAYRNALRAV